MPQAKVFSLSLKANSVRQNLNNSQLVTTIITTASEYKAIRILLVCCRKKHNKYTIAKSPAPPSPPTPNYNVPSMHEAAKLADIRYYRCCRGTKLD